MKRLCLVLLTLCALMGAMALADSRSLMPQMAQSVETCHFRPLIILSSVSAAA